MGLHSFCLGEEGWYSASGKIFSLFLVFFEFLELRSTGQTGGSEMLTFSNPPRQNNKCRIVGPMIIPIFNITKENPTKSEDKHVFFTLSFMFL